MKLQNKFSGEAVELHNINDNIVFRCKTASLYYNNYVDYLKNPKNNILGYGDNHEPCKIYEYNDVVRIGCLKDSKSNFNKLKIEINKIINNGK